MKKIKFIESVAEYNASANHETLHPLVSLVDLSKASKRRFGEIDAISLGFFAVFLKQGTQCTLRYGRRNYDYQDGTLVFLAPRQVVEIIADDPDYQPSGYALIFHPDLLHGTQLAQRMKEYTFFSYEVNEALHISERERQIVMECFQKVEYEIGLNVDKHSKKLIVGSIELLLDYCLRFYDRQFFTRENVNRGILEKFESLVDDYFESDKPKDIGPPAVAYFADALNLSANYLGDLMKKETGKSAQEQLQLRLIEIAKQRIFSRDKTISEIAYEMGFKYPQHFTRFFKQQVGSTPVEYRNSVN